MLSKQLDPVLTLGHLLNKPYFSDIASEDEWRNSHSEEASFTLRKKLARAKTEAALEGISQHEDCILRAPRGSSSQSKWESRGGCPEPLRVNKSSPTTTASSDSAWERHGSLDITAASCTADTKGRTQRVQTYTPSGAVLVTDSEGQSRLQTPERSSGGERRVRFGEQGLEEHQAGEWAEVQILSRGRWMAVHVNARLQCAEAASSIRDSHANFWAAQLLRAISTPPKLNE